MKSPTNAAAHLFTTARAIVERRVARSGAIVGAASRSPAMILLVLGWVVFSTIGGCRRDAAKPASNEARVVVYCSVDETFAKEVLSAFERRTGIKVSAIYDSEAGKTTGLVNRIIREGQSGRPRADVWWSGELFGTMRLAEEGHLAPFDPPSASDIPARYRDSNHRWTATAVRARVIAFDPSRTPADDVPARWEDLAKPEFAARTAIANPLFGTTRGHVATMFALWGTDRGRAFLQSLRDNGALIADGNSATVRAVIDGRAALALTDSDDVWVAQRGGASLAWHPLDMGDGGTLLIPCSAAVVRGGPNGASARRLVDYLVSAEVEGVLARSDSRNIPVRPSLRKELGMELPSETKVPFEEIAARLDEADRATRSILIR